MSDLKLAENVTAEAIDPLSTKREAYWIAKGKKESTRVVALNQEVVNDQEVAWTQARITDAVRRNLLQRLMKSDMGDTLFDPSGREMQAQSQGRKGFLFTLLQKGLDLESEVRSRMSGENPRIVKIADTKMLLEGAVPMMKHTKSGKELLAELGEAEVSVEEAEKMYRHSFGTIMDVVTKRSTSLTPESAQLLYELDLFRRDHVRWARVTPDNQLFSLEGGTMGDGWVYILPPGHPLREQQTTVHKVELDNAGLNVCLSILPAAMTGKWALLGAVHELQHFKDLVTGVEPKKGATREQFLAGEHRAFSVEAGLAHALAEVPLGPALEAYVQKAIRSSDPMRAIGELLNQQLSSVAQSVDQAMGAGKAKSAHEFGIRQALYQMLLGFELSKNRFPDNSTQRQEMEKRFIETVYVAHGHLSAS